MPPRALANTTRLQVLTTPQTEARIERLIAHGVARSKSEAVRLAIDRCYELVAHLERGGRIVVARPDGSEKELLLIF